MSMLTWCRSPGFIIMPRKPDPVLEQKIAAAALRLLDRGGEEAITLRAVAREAGTTTPTIYERFHDRDELIREVVALATEEIVAMLRPKASIEGILAILPRSPHAPELDGRDVRETVCSRRSYAGF